MFTGIVEELGTVRSLDARGDGIRISIDATTVVSDAEMGASIAVNGCCLTVVEFDATGWSADAVPETMDRTNLGDLVVGGRVNLERPLRADGRFGGHIVQGHVDATTTIESITRQDDGSFRYRFALPSSLRAYVVEKGSITLDGISLTVASVDDPGSASNTASFDIAIIPHTASVTTLGTRSPGGRVNVEVDVLAKYVERQVAASLAAAAANPSPTNSSANNPEPSNPEPSNPEPNNPEPSNPEPGANEA